MSGMLWTSNCCAIAGSSSMLILTTLYAPSRIAAICSTIGDTCRHGPHHGAQKSTMTGKSLRRTSFSKVAVVTAFTGPSGGGSGIGSDGRSPATTASNHDRACCTLSIATWCSIGYSVYTTGTPCSSRSRARSRERDGDLARREAEVVPGEARHPGHGDGPARKHGHEPPVRIEVREDDAEVALVGAEPVDEEQQAVGVAPAHDIRDQRHGSLRCGSFGSARTQHPRGRR